MIAAYLFINKSANLAGQPKLLLTWHPSFIETNKKRFNTMHVCHIVSSNVPIAFIFHIGMAYLKYSTGVFFNK